MSLGYDLKLEQSQKLIMTPELRQAIKVLQLSSLELVDYINEILVENPLIETKEGESILPSQEKKEVEIDWEEYLKEKKDYLSDHVLREIKEETSFENMVTRDVQLQEYLLSQLGCLALNKLEQRIGRYLIGNINSNGYLVVSVEQAANDVQAAPKLVKKMLQLLQTFDPPGIGARDLRECLSLQLKQKNNADKDTITDLLELVKNHLEDLAAGKFNKVAAAMNLPIIRIQELADLLKTLNPKPGAAFSSGEETRYIVPDVFIECVEGEYMIRVNDSLVPRLTINKMYSSILNKPGNTDDQTKSFIENKLNQALWLIRSIEQRRMTIYRVTEALLEKQREFFVKGIKYLKPLTLKEIADKIDVHESTVSRATSNKYVQTPHGIFEFKFFFTPGLKTGKGGSTSSESIKQLLQEIIKKEDATKPYSDQSLANLLQERGIHIARRTVSKYREELGILSAGQRRRYQ